MSNNGCCIFRWNEPMAHHTTFRVGGPVACLARPRTEGALEDLLKRLRSEGTPWFILGGGSNILAPDASWNAVAVKLDLCCSGIDMLGIGPDGWMQVRVGAGMRMAEWLRFCVEKDLHGAEFLVGIPGTLGGALVMNAGTGDGCIADALLWIDIIDRDGSRKRLQRPEIKADYRSMGLDPDWTVLGGCFRLRTSNSHSMKLRMAEMMRRRKQTQPLGYPSAGCIFKNPPGNSAGALIDGAGLKGLRSGGAEVSQKHANWIINRGNATAEDIMSLIRRIENEVLGKYGIHLEREIRVLAQ